MTAGLQRTMIAARTAHISHLALVVVSCMLVVACGEGGSDEQQASAVPTDVPNGAPSVSNAVPRISGSPSGSAVIGQSYSFSPTASDGDGDVLTFSIAGKPAWAAFDPATGRLSGTPTSADLGTYTVTIRATDGADDAVLATFVIEVVGTATGSATITWAPPTQNSDGTPLTNLAGYKVYWGADRNNLTNSVTLQNAGLSSYVVEQLTPATWYFSTTAFNNEGVESQRSNIASKAVM